MVGGGGRSHSYIITEGIGREQSRFNKGSSVARTLMPRHSLYKRCEFLGSHYTSNANLDEKMVRISKVESRMIKRLVVVGLLTFLVGGFCVPSIYPAEESLDGHWEGAITQPVGELKISADFTAQGAGIRGTFDLPAAAVFHWPLSASYESSKVRFRLPTGLLFDGELRGNTISGTVPSPSGGHIDDFYLKRTPPAPMPYREEEIRFRSGSITLAGTLRLPLKGGKHPALFLMQGSGDSDREAESFYADHFARHGIATLVYDKRGTGDSSGDYRDESFNDFAADALAGIHYLQSRPEVRSMRVGLYGRSHGGIVAPLAASLSKNVAFIINVSGAGVAPYRQVTFQTEAQMRRDGFSQTEIEEAIAYLNLKWKVARTGGVGWERLQAATQDASDKKWLARVQPASKLEDIVPSWKLQMGYDPMPALRKLRCPVLAVFGELDTLTPVAETTANYRMGLKKAANKDYTITVFPNADHALLVWPKADATVHWPTLAAGYLEKMTNWINQHAVVDSLRIYRQRTARF